MKVVVTGGAGFIGTMLARRLLQLGELTGASGRAEPIDSLLLLDVASTGPSDPSDPPNDPRVRRVSLDVTDTDQLQTVVNGDDVSVFHLAAMVSSACEADFDGGMRTNLDGTRAVLEAVRVQPGAGRVVFASSIAVFGGAAVTAAVSDTTKATPQTTYGLTKAIGELLINDYTRRGFIDGRSARLPTVIIRPGRPNAAASSWVSGLFRERLAGTQAVLPVDLDTRHPVTGYRTLVENLVRLHEVHGEDIGPDRGVNLPALSVTAQQMIDALAAATPDRVLGPVVHRPDPSIQQIFAGWARSSSFERAQRLGLHTDQGLEPIIHEYIDDFLTQCHS